MKPHPKGDRLRVVDVDWGSDMSVVVTNALNVEEGMKVIFAVRGELADRWAGSGGDAGAGEETRLNVAECARAS